MPELSIVIPVFNCLALTQACQRSLEATIGTHTDFEVIFVDNGSTDGSGDWLSALPATRYRLIRNESNLGYAAANNAASRQATGRLLLLLNNDIVLMPGWYEPMRRVLLLAPHAGVVGNVQREAETGLIDHAGILFTDEGVPLHFGRDLVTPPRPRYRRFPAVTGACMLMLRETFVRLGGFNQEFRNGYEDVDFCLRLRDENLYCYVANQSVIYHHVSASPGRHEADHANFERLRNQWGARIAALWQARRLTETRRQAWLAEMQASEPMRRERRRDGWRYLRKHALRPWRYNAGRLRQAAGKIVDRGPAPPPIPAPDPFFFE